MAGSRSKHPFFKTVPEAQKVRQKVDRFTQSKLKRKQRRK